VIVLVAVPHGPILVVFPITMALGFSAGLFSTPLISTPIVSAPIVSTIVPTAVMPVSIVMGKQRPWLLAGHTGQGRPRVAGSRDRSLNGCDFSRENRG
jgi:ABC-type sulfate transport system permease subunit